MYDLDVSPDGTRLAASFGEISGKQEVRVFDDRGDARRSDATPDRAVRLRHGGAERLRVLARRTYLYGSSYYTGVSNIFRYDLTRDEGRRRHQRRNRVLPARCRSADGRADRVPLHRARASFRRASTPHPLDDVSADHVSRRAARRGASGAQDVDASARPADVPFDSMPKTRRAVPARRRPAARIVLSDRPGLQGHGRRRHAVQLLRSAAASTARTSRPRTRRSATCPATNACICAPSTSATTGTRARRLNAADFYDLFGPTKIGRKGYSIGARPHEHADLRRAAAPDARRQRPRRRQPRSPAAVPERAGGRRSSSSTLDATLTYTTSARSLGHVDDETGRKWTVAIAGRSWTRDVVPRACRHVRRRARACRSAHSSIWLRSAAGFSPHDRD